ncbi:hypothetical protein GGF46_003903 [Coemansia sp. RSA 552]|nr:hypothetical protein GGF46_003903 [Coemansia sp. RSA 552]
MSTNLDKSLDDIIKETPRRSGGARRNGRGSNRSSPYQSRDGRVQKGGGGGSKQQQQDMTQMMFSQQQQLLAMLQQQQKQQSSRGRGGSKILIGNLDFNVSEADLRTLFEQVGPVAKAKLNYSRQGRSNGSGEVIFKDASNAKRAYDKYHNVQLDGRAMKIEVVLNNPTGGAAVPAVMPQLVPQMFMQQQQQHQGGAGGRRRRGGANGGGNTQDGGGRQRGRRNADKEKEKSTPPTKEQLDDDLDTYMKEGSK